MTNKTSFLQPLLGQTVIELKRLALLENNNVVNEPFVLSDTLVFTLSNGSCYELLVTQATTILKKIEQKQEFVISFPLEDDEVIDSLTMNSLSISERMEISFPITIANIIETWGDENDPYLVGVEFLDQNRKSLFSILTETDEVVFLEPEEFKRAVERMVFEYKFICIQAFSSPTQT